MDIITHAITGAATGALFGRPIVGAAAAVWPDLVLGFRRKYAPTEYYDIAHAVIPMSCLMYGPIVSFTLDWKLGVCMMVCYWTHIILDVLTHGDDWAPKLFAPFSQKRCSFGDDWEWFNRSWWVGLTVAIIWTAICLAIVL